MTKFVCIYNELSCLNGKTLVNKCQYLQTCHLPHILYIYIYIYLLSVQVTEWIFWFWDVISLGNHSRFLKFFSLHLEPSMEEQMIKWCTQWWVKSIYESGKKNSWENLLKVRLFTGGMRTLERRIGGKYVRGTLKYGCYIWSWFCLRNVYWSNLANIYIYIYIYMCVRVTYHLYTKGQNLSYL